MKTWNLAAFVLTALIVTSVLSQEVELPSGVDDETLTTAEIEAATAFAVTVAEKGTEDFVRVFKESLETLYGLHRPQPEGAGLTTLSVASRGVIDSDQRYRGNLTRNLDQPELRIWGGTRVPPGAYPDAVAVFGSGSICTGTLIAPSVVVTAAHCDCGGVNDEVVFGDSTSFTRETIEVDRSVSKISCSSRSADGDVALLFLKRAATAAPRALAPSSWIDNATALRAVGFGRTEDPIREPIGIKRVVDVPIASAKCEGQVVTRNGAIDDDAYYGCGRGHEIVAGLPRLDRDTCNGDSGGPVYIVGPDGEFYLAAATSRAVVRPGNRSCGDGGIYARLDGGSLTWIQQQGVSVTIGAAGEAQPAP
jgi:hypothetical protein